MRFGETGVAHSVWSDQLRLPEVEKERRNRDDENEGCNKLEPAFSVRVRR